MGVLPHRIRSALSAAALAAALSACSEQIQNAPRTVAPADPAPVVSEVVLAAAAPAREPIRYDRDIRPILSDRCFRCHGHDSNKRQARLRLDSFEGATADRGGYAAIAPGDVSRSELWRRINCEDPEERMPPPTSNRKRLSSDERELVRRWIEEGAPYEPHWAFVPPVRPEVPAVRRADWCRNPVDRFIAAELERESVEPSAEAEPGTLIRRAFLDLTGLPPTPEESAAFLADAGADPTGAYERWIDKLLTQEPYRTRYAERMAVPWLDASRYADTCGIHMDAGRSIWLWRDWLLQAFRENLPFDRFVTEQIAGDLLPDASEAQKIASGFNRNHVTTDEGGAIAEEYLVEYAVDRAATTGSVFLGLTMGCARCHEHKFDPISQEEFYRFYAYFNSIEEPGLYSQLPDPRRAFEPFLAVPTPAQREELAKLRADLAALKTELDAPMPEEDAQREAFFERTRQESGLAWLDPRVVSATSAGGATLATQADGSVLASGENPDKDEHELHLRIEGSAESGRDLRLISLEALGDPSLPHDGPGRADNGNAVLTEIQVEAAPLSDPSQRRPVPLSWAWADREQPDGDFAVLNAIDGRDTGWAIDAHHSDGDRIALFLAAEPFGFAGGTELVVRLRYHSTYGKHAFGRVRIRAGRLGEAGLSLLPAAASPWYLVGPFPAEKSAVFDQVFGPEQDAAIDFGHNFGAGNQYWKHVAELTDDRRNNDLPKGINATYVGRNYRAPTARKLEVSLGSDDGFRLFLDGREVASRRIDRALAMDQDQVSLELPSGEHALVFKVVNTGGDAGFYWRAKPRDNELAGDLVATLLPKASLTGELEMRRNRAWRTAFSPGYRERTQRIAALEKRATEVNSAIPLTMVMQELAMPRETFVLTRGQYDHPDKARPVERGVPEALGALPEGAPANRLGLAQWLTAPGNPLVARVAVNRLWETVFGTGLVRTSEDFGMQGEWPSHPELLDWLAVEFRESGWDVQRMLKLIVTSSTYRQSSRARPELRERDPENRWLACFPRKRLGAEQIRDQALYVAGLLVEQVGGPSVKPYQPEGLWQEVAMPQSNTRIFERGKGADLWRRSLYTYWKRACPPPALLTLDAPTREFCTIRRPSTNTPLQALALWNDEQFVEAARVLAQRTLAEGGDEASRLRRLFQRCTGRGPDADELAALTGTLAGFRERYSQAPDDALHLLEVGQAPGPQAAEGTAPSELAAWTLIANAVLNLDATISRS
jgi:uncharacterized protein DUF1553/uncharacterized protein DUF1549/cytochrome c